MNTFPVRFGRKGFTLIELLIVIVIIGILAGVVLVVLNPAKQQRKSAESVLSANTNKLCLALNSCAATTATAGNCGNATFATTLALIGAADPTGIPAASTFASAISGNVVTITGTLSATAGVPKTDSTACNYSCSFDFGAGTATRLLPDAGCW